MKPAIRSYLSVVCIVVWICVSLLAPAMAADQIPSNPNPGQINAEQTAVGPTPGPAPVEQNPPPEPGPSRDAAPAPAANGTQLVSIDFNNVDIGVFIKFISDLTNRNFIVDDTVKGKVTIISPGKITVAEAYKVFESVLEVYGFSTVKAGEITKIIPSPEARTKNIKTRIEEESGAAGDSVVTQIIPLRFADPNEIKTLFTPLISKNSIIQAYGPTNTLIITDVHSNVQRLLRILKVIDITGIGQQIALLPVENASAAKLVTLLQTVFKSGPKGKGAGREITFVADERTNVIVVLASEGEIENVRQLVKSLDVETPKGQGNINVYYLEHATAEEVVKVLLDIPQKGADGKQEEGRPEAPAISNKMRIAADKATNSLIITGDLEEYLVLESIIKKIDIPRSMVYIEALIMEVNVNKEFQLGTEWQAGGQTSYDGKDMVYGGGFNGGADSLVKYTPTGTTASSPVIPTFTGSGLSLGMFGEALEIAGIKFPSIAAIINAYKQDKDVRILSTPQILTTDNQEAKIYVGKNLPFQTSKSASSTLAGDVYNSYEYKDVGKTLKITPQISKDRMVRLTLSLEVTAVESVVENKVTTLKRTMDTTAIVQDGNTVVLGGLIDDTEAFSEGKVPCLGDIPGLGLLFRSSGSAFEKSNLFIFLTPKVIMGPQEANTVYKNKRDHIEGAKEKSINLYNNKKEAPAEELRMPAPPLDSESKPHSTAPGGSALPQTRRPNEPAGNMHEVNPDPNSALLLEEGVDVSESSGEVAGYTIQVATVKLADKANEMLAQLTAAGYAAYTVRMEVDGVTWYRVRIGYFAGKKDAGTVLNRLKADQFTPILIKL